MGLTMVQGCQNQLINLRLKKRQEKTRGWVRKEDKEMIECREYKVNARENGNA